MTERRGWGWRATREVIVDEEQIDWNLFRNGNQNRPEQRVHPSGLACRTPCILTGSAFSSLDFTWQIRPAIGPAVNSDNLRIIGPSFFVYEEWPLGECRLSLFGIDGILLYVSHRSVLQPAKLSRGAWPLRGACWSSTSRALNTPQPSRPYLPANIDTKVEKLLYSWLPSAVHLRFGNEAARQQHF
jgi:hypothetical protein